MVEFSITKNEQLFPTFHFKLAKNPKRSTFG